ncbi:nitroreductase family protein [Ktedonosporobacter rubrisoli]|uniref:Nitroreductase family protein n=1 Tax=Ktedonosporobacter rubrisoli TaxID=2509675 RepID=A0A4P6JL62_KTERU|nr:nitroreductase family protein [Ktedonosporobacter rubrisoli]QBD75813.1 nitroreductase family protein [Ktedonosporobacter rubrisoli]
MPILDLSFDEVLSTTRAVRRRLDFTRPVEPEVIQECLSLAVQAPTPGGIQSWHFLVVTDPALRQALAALYRKSASSPGGQEDMLKQMIAAASSEKEAADLTRKVAPARYLTAHFHEIPVLVIPCIEGRAGNLSAVEQAAHWGGIWPATWSFMLAARSRGLGTVLTTLHLAFEQEAADILGIPYKHVMQVGLIPVAYTLGTTFKPATRKPLDTMLHWERWRSKQEVGSAMGNENR